MQKIDYLNIALNLAKERLKDYSFNTGRHISDSTDLDDAFDGSENITSDCNDYINNHIPNFSLNFTIKRTSSIGCTSGLYVSELGTGYITENSQKYNKKQRDSYFNAVLNLAKKRYVDEDYNTGIGDYDTTEVRQYCGNDFCDVVLKTIDAQIPNFSKTHKVQWNTRIDCKSSFYIKKI